MDDRQKIKDEFYKLCNSIDENVIIEMNDGNADAGLNNVVVGLHDECFGLRLFNDPDQIFYQLFYVNGKKGLKGFVLHMTLDNPHRDDLVFMFSNHLTMEYEHLDSIDIFNTFQQHTRSMLEKEGHFTVSSLEMEKFNGMDTTIIAKAKGISVIPLIDKVKFLREYFGNRHSLHLMENQNHIYLMLNKRSGLIKIGRSINPRFREKTLQGEEPEIFILSIWAAPREIERELHNKFRDKKKRGEWFKLKSRDMKEIKDRMNEFI
jgi:hypothetical protein